MDAYLSEEALAGLKACLLLAGRSVAAGLLLGHKRGHRVFVESVFPTSEGAVSSLEKLRQADAALGGKVVGFFSSGRDSSFERALLQPIGLGKLYLDVLSFSRDKVEILPSMVDFDGEFTLLPLKLKVAAAGKNRKRPA